MATTGTSANEFFEWLDGWWGIASGWLHDPQPFDDPWTWDGRVYRAAVLPDEIDGTNITSLKRLVRGMVAYSDPGPINGPQPTEQKLQELGSEAWATYQRLHHHRDTIEQDADDPWHGWQSTADYTDELGVSGTVVKENVRDLADDGLTQRRGTRGNINMRESVFQRLKRKR